MRPIGAAGLERSMLRLPRESVYCPGIPDLMRRPTTLLLLALSLLCAPTGVYELVQKSAERQGVQNHGIWALSARAETNTPWRPRTGQWWVDHAVHEWRETQLFYRLAAEPVFAKFRGEAG